MTSPALTCRSCRSSRLEVILSLGKTPLANALLTKEQVDLPEPVFPLDLVLCRQCSLVQIAESVPPEELFRDYPYFSSFSDTMLHHAKTLVDRVVAQRELRETSLVVEVASNDGYLLQHYRNAGFPVLGIEPALNIARIAEKRGIPTLTDFFDSNLANRLASEGVHADVIHAHNVLAHVPDLNGFVSGIGTLLSDTGSALIEVPYVIDLIDHTEFDTIYHEHLSYFSLMSLWQLFTRHDLTIVDVERIPIHGGSLRISVEKASSVHVPKIALSVDRLLEEERSWGIDGLARYQQFGEKVDTLRRDLVVLLHDLRAQGSRIAAYGASAKGSTLLNYCRISRETLEFVVDRSTVKQGRYTPGTHLPIYAPRHLLDEPPDYVLLLTWNFVDEILEQQSEYRKSGGRFIIPIPELRII